MQSNLALVIISSYFNWYQNSQKREAFYTKEIKGENYWVNHDFKMKDWKLTAGVKIIDGYTCYKAERKEFNNRAGIDVFFTAWHTPEIPVPYGPIGNGGLPGLILQLHKHKAVIYTVNKITLNPKKTKVKSPKEGKKISIREKIKLLREARKVTKD
ncbi:MULTISPECIES: GLPGLI family protein [Tenacibaculum]|uniref:GLPGLI family protein n=1 Tax=Tenacibaculum TaxID=104267 RepID=UPI001F0A4C50|nr:MULTISPECIES: GLPGLI family protein [Tenacibaculum]MCH3881566.1 GLPGLI family protein [Tenacibaculum aquimarinum]MDO6598839.1 GLPGLI family protein [Tenacibaculum sp. 1_MG-2023]